MKIVRVFFVPIFLWSCAVPKMITTYADWDINQDNTLNRSEFVNTYVQTDYFSKWGKDTGIDYPTFFERVFKNVDVDNDSRIDKQEFEGHIRPYFFKMFNGSFIEWDDDRGGTVDHKEFMGHAIKSNLGSLWDTSSDYNINERELGAGMFYLCDANDDNQITAGEFETWKVGRQRIRRD